MGTLKSLRLHTKVSLAICLPCMFVSALVTSGLTAFFVNSHRLDFQQRYQALSDQVGSTLHELEVVTDMAGKAVLAAYREQEAAGKFKTVDDMRAFADLMGISAIYTYRKDGLTALWTHPPADPMFSAFDICPEYVDFFSGDIQTEISPFVPVANEPSIKFFKALNIAGDQLVNIAVYSTFLNDLLRASFRDNADVLDIDVETPSGVSLRTGTAAERHDDATHARFLSRTSSTVQECCQCVQKGLAASRFDYHYRIVVHVSLATLERICFTARMFGAIIFVCSAAASFVVARLLATHLVSRIESIDSVAANVFKSGDLNVEVPAQPHDDEIGRLSTTFNAMLTSLRDGQARALAHERASSIAAYARQVAHDIRSPLAAIRMALSDLGETPEETRRLLRNATFRIEDISNQLFEVNAVNEAGECRSKEEVRAVLLPSVLELVVSEKRTEYRQHLHVDIEFGVNESSYGVFVDLVASDFKRVVSNLVNNAVEALNGTGTVRINVRRDGDEAVVEIADNGCGMPAHVLEKLGKEEITHGKSDGHGIGVHSAQAVLQRFHGCITYESTQGQGTLACARLPLADPPPWFLDSLEISPQSQVVIVDDDVSIHGVWDERFRRAMPRMRVQHVSSPTDLARIATHAVDDLSTCFLVDFEFLGEKTTGIDLIDELKISDRSVLVTSRFEEEVVLSGCRRLGIRMIPKSAAQYVPIRPQAPPDASVLDAALLDDDHLIRKSWMMAAKRAGLRLKTYANEVDLMRDLAAFPLALPIYVDFDLSSARTGLDVGESLAERGFTHVYLATGFPKTEFDASSKIAGIVSKEVPF